VSAGSIVPGAQAAPGRATLLLDGAPVQDVPRRSLDLQVRFGPAGARTSPTPAVVLCTRAADPDADELSLRLAARSVPLIRIDADRGDDDHLAWDGDCVTIERGGRTYLPRVLWTRLFAPAGRADDGLRAAAAQHAREQAAARVSNLAALPSALTINPGGRLADAPNRLAQLAFARAHGLRTPCSLVTPDPAAAADRLAADELVVKAVGPHFCEVAPGRAVALIPRRIERAQLRGLPLQSSPLLVQEAIEHVRELRVFVVGTRCISFALQKPALDAAAVAPDSIVVEPAVLAGDLTSRVLGLVAALGRDVAAVDLLDTGDDVVFLEANASGSWRWFEHRTGTAAVSEAITAWVADRYAETT
jgi:glutathione synthase/RimK-type ligase-like ATP-grasp enzyme